jgi:hypothetical protein
VITGVTEITEICTKQDMSRWTRAHADAPGITWSVFAGPGGTMIIVEHGESRSSLDTAQASRDTAVTAPGLAETAADAAAQVADPFMSRPQHSARTFA